MSAVEWCLPVPGDPSRSLTGLMELPNGCFVAVDDRATDEDYSLGAELARKRLGRCKPGSVNWHWYRAVVAEHERRVAHAAAVAHWAERLRRNRRKAVRQ